MCLLPLAASIKVRNLYDLQTGYTITKFPITLWILMAFGMLHISVKTLFSIYPNTTSSVYPFMSLFYTIKYVNDIVKDLLNA